MELPGSEEDAMSRSAVGKLCFTMCVGRVVVEVFIDMVPLAARTFVNRCRPGSTGSFQGTAVHKSLRGLAVYTGVSNKCAEPTTTVQPAFPLLCARYRTWMSLCETKAAYAQVCNIQQTHVVIDHCRFVVGVRLRPSPYLRHVESGTVSISSTGQELAFGLARSLTLDATHLVRLLLFPLLCEARGKPFLCTPELCGWQQLYMGVKCMHALCQPANKCMCRHGPMGASSQQMMHCRYHPRRLCLPHASGSL